MKTTELKDKTATDVYGVLAPVLTENQAIELIKLLIPYLKNKEIIIDHVGEYDKRGEKHSEAIQVIQFNNSHQVTIWNKGIRYYNGDRFAGESSESDVWNVFDVYRLLNLWGLVS